MCIRDRDKRARNVAVGAGGLEEPPAANIGRRLEFGAIPESCPLAIGRAGLGVDLLIRVVRIDLSLIHI